MQKHQEIWELYVASWKAKTTKEKRDFYQKCLSPDCGYNDPLIATKGWDELEAYMLDFHQQIPGGHFVTTYFLTHSNKSIARWEMRNADKDMLGDGISYGEYNPDGKLTSLTGFFKLPPQ